MELNCIGHKIQMKGGELEGWRSARTSHGVSRVIRTFILTSLVEAEGGKKNENSLLKGRSDLVKADIDGDEVLSLLGAAVA